MTPSPNALTFRSIQQRRDIIAATHSRSLYFSCPYFPKPYFQTQFDKLYNSTPGQCVARHERNRLEVSRAVGFRFSMQLPEILCSNP